MHKRLLTVLVVLVVGMVMIFAQGEKEPQTSSVSTGSNKYDVDTMKFNNVTLKLFTRYGTDTPDETYFRQKVTEFSNADNGITVIHESIPTESDYLDNLRTKFATGDTPNVFIEYGGSRVLDYAESNVLLDMQPYLDQNSSWRDSFNSSMWDSLRYSGIDGTWGVPFKMYTVALYCNMELFKQVGIDHPPVSFDELLADCEIFKSNGIKPFQVGEKDIWRFGHLHNSIVYKSLGCEAADKLADRSLQYNSPEMLRTFQIISDLLSKGYLGDDILSTNYATEKSIYKEGGCAMRWDGSWYVSEIMGTPIYEKTSAVSFPYIEKEYQHNEPGGSSDMFFVSTLNKSNDEIAASVRLLEFLTSEEYTAGCNEVASAIFPIKFTPTKNTPRNPLMNEVQEIANSATIMRTDIQNYDSQSHMLDTVRSALQGLAMGNTPEQAANEIVRKIAENN